MFSTFEGSLIWLISRRQKQPLKYENGQQELERGMRTRTGKRNHKELRRICKHNNDGGVTDERWRLLPSHTHTRLKHSPKEWTSKRRMTQGVMTEVQHDGEEASGFHLWPPCQFILGQPLTFKRKKILPCATVRKSFFMGESTAQEANDQLTSRLGEDLSHFLIFSTFTKKQLLVWMTSHWDTFQEKLKNPMKYELAILLKSLWRLLTHTLTG